MVPLLPKDQVTERLAAVLADLIAKSFLSAEQHVLTQADKVRAGMLDDLERQRAGLESIVGLFAQRLRQQEEGLSGLQSELGSLVKRLDRQAQAIRSLGEVQARHAELLARMMEVLKLLGEAKTEGGSSTPSGG